MRSQLIIAALAAAVSAQTDTGCPTGKGVHVVALGGEGTTTGDLGYLQSLTTSVLNAIPGSNLFQVGYPSGADGPDAVAAGLSGLQSHLPTYHANCPNAGIVLLGYSVGAAATMDTLCGDPNTGEGGLDKDTWRKTIVANIAYGDLTFVPGKSYHVGSCDNVGVVPRQFPGHCFPYGRKTKSYCDAGDIECCSGNDEAVHFSYPAKYDGAATDWVVQRHNTWLKRRAAGN